MGNPPRTTTEGTLELGPIWALAAPVRAYVRRFPIQRGKGLLVRRVLLPILPADPAYFVASLPGGGRVQLHPRETLGFATLLYGGFETAEIACAIELATPGTIAFDVGANVGLFTVALGRVIGHHGCVVAVEPDHANVIRLVGNLDLNGIGNVRVVQAVAGDREDLVELKVADDRAYNSVVRIEGKHHAVSTASVQSVRLDAVWEDLGRPAVSIIKVDVEGAEAPVLRGGRQMLIQTAPAVLAEANDGAHLALLRSELEPLGYRLMTWPGFQRWNHLFLRADSS